jgi:uncharacterized protein YndB with AHSA1/START domain
MDKNLIARVSINIDAPSEKVWDALITPETIKQYMFGADVVSDWREGSPIVWKGEGMIGHSNRAEVGRESIGAVGLGDVRYAAELFARRYTV